VRRPTATRDPVRLLYSLCTSNWWRTTRRTWPSR